MNSGLQFAMGCTILVASATIPASIDGDSYEPPRVVESAGTEVRTWSDIEARGELRLLVLAGETRNLADLDTPVRVQIRHAAEFARSLHLEPVVVPVEHAEHLTPALLSGRGDIIIANWPITPEYSNRIAFTVPLDRSQRMLVGHSAWAVRPQADALRDLLNRFVTQQRLVQPERQSRTADLSGIRSARALRVATRNSAVNFFVWRGQLLGFEYELAEHFARELNVRLEIVVADDSESLFDMVRNGEADIAAAFLSPMARDDDSDIRWSRPYHRAHQMVVGRAGTGGIDSVAELSGRTFHVRPESRYERTLKILAHVHDLELDIQPVATDQEPELTLERVAQGEYDLTLADEHLVRNAMMWIEGLEPGLTIGNEITHHWAVRTDNPALRAAIDDFFEREYRGLTYNTLYAKYFRDRGRVRGHSTQRIDLQHGREISPWDDIVREHAQTYGLDWRLILAQIYQESSFNPRARSWMGAKGLMQIMPPTARQLGIDADLTDPETSIAGGIRYLDWLRDRFDGDLQVNDRMWFMLAAYNAGIGHVRDARRLAAELGYDPDRWFDNVEIAMEKLSQREYFQHASHGYVRGHEPTDYVRKIRERYLAYILWTEDCWPVCPDATHPQPREPTTRPPGMLQMHN